MPSSHPSQQPQQLQAFISAAATGNAMGSTILRQPHLRQGVLLSHLAEQALLPPPPQPIRPMPLGPPAAPPPMWDPLPIRPCSRSKTDPRNSGFGFVAQHRFHFIVGRPRTHVISSLDFGSRVYLRAQWELARSLAERRLLAGARMTGSLRSRRWPPAPPWRRPPTTSAALLRTLSS